MPLNIVKTQGCPNISKHKGKGKGTVHLRTVREDPEGDQRYSYTLSLNLGAGWEVSGQRHAPAVFPPRRTQYLLYRRLGGSQGRFGRVRKISPSTGIRSPDRPACSQLLYRLSYRARFVNNMTKVKFMLSSKHTGQCKQ